MSTGVSDSAKDLAMQSSLRIRWTPEFEWRFSMVIFGGESAAGAVCLPVAIGGQMPTYLKALLLYVHALSCDPIGALPATIHEPGCYTLTRDVVYEGKAAAIVVQAPNVRINFAGHTLKGAPTSDETAIGVRGEGADLVIEHGTIKGFNRAVAVVGARTIVRDMTVEGSASEGIRLIGKRQTVINSRVLNIGVDGVEAVGEVHTHAILVAGERPTIRNNFIANVRGNSHRRLSEGIAIALTGGVTNSIVAGNTIKWDALCPDPSSSLTASTFAVWIGGYGNGSGTLTNNSVENAHNGIVADFFVEGVVAGNTFKWVRTAITDRLPDIPETIEKHDRSLTVGANSCDGRTCDVVALEHNFADTESACAAMRGTASLAPSPPG